MKYNIKLLMLGLLVTGISACTQPTKQKQDTDAKSITEQDISSAKTPFKEGVIQIKISTPGSALGELLQKIDPIKGNISGQMKEMSEKLSAKDKKLIEAESKKNGMMNLAVLMLPLKSTLYVKGNEATAKFDAVTFHGENYVDDRKKIGLVYAKSQNSGKDMTISYTGDNYYKMSSNEVNNKAYNIVDTKEAVNVAGYPCTKRVYTLKNADKAQKTETGIPGTSGTIYKIDVWTSTLMPSSVNFLHPLYVEENAGIMKLLIQYEKDSDLKILYEFSSVESRVVTAQEMSIQKTKKIYDFGKDQMAVGLQMMGIVFGM